MDTLVGHPLLTVFSADKILYENDDWSAEQGNAEKVTSAVASANTFTWTTGSKDAALVVILQPGAYTAQVSGKNRTTGTALVEIYVLD